MASQTDVREPGDSVSAEQLGELRENLTFLARRRPKGDQPVPVFLVRGPGGPALADAVRRRLLDGDKRLVPFVWVDGPARETGPDDTEQDIALFETIARELERRMPASMGQLRLWRYRTMRTVLDAEIRLDRQKAQRRQLRNFLYTRREQGWGTETAAGIPDGVLQARQWVARKVLLDLHRVVYGWRLSKDPALRWVGEQLPGGGDSRDFFVSALAVTATGDHGDDPGVVRRALMLCLLSDLAAAIRGRRLSVRRRRRTTPFVLVFPSVATSDPAHRFLGTLGPAQSSLLRAGGRRLRWMRRSATLVLACLRDGAAIPESLASGDPAGTVCRTPARTSKVIRPLITGGSLAQHPLPPAVCVDVPDDQVEVPSDLDDGTEPVTPDEDGRDQGGPFVPARLHLVPLASWIGILVGAAVASWLVLNAGSKVRDVVSGPSSPCPGIARTEGTDELIGLGDGTIDCTFAPEPPDGLDEGLSALQEDQRAVEAEIAAENARVLQDAEQGQPYGTVVFFAPLTVPDVPERRGQSAVRQLRGIALAQAEANRQAGNNHNKPRVRVLLANPGDRFARGPAVAQQIRRRAQEDETIIGVVGIGQSRAQSRRAIEILAEAHLPVVAGPVTGDTMVENSPYYYQVTPRNRRIAAVLAAFTRGTRVVGQDAGGTPTAPARNAVVVLDPHDDYSRNLADDFTRAFDDAGHDVKDTFSYEAEGPSPATLSQLAKDVCRRIDPETDVLFFASRSQQFSGLLDDLDNEGCAEGLTIVGGPELTKFVQDPGTDLGSYPQFRLYYAAFASPAVPEGSRTQLFVDRYRTAYRTDDITVDISDPAATYDALFALWRATQEVGNSSERLLPDTVAGKLDDGAVQFPGVTGPITFRGDHDTDRVPPDKLVLVLEALPRPSAEPVLQCGRLSVDDDPSTHQSALCPDVD